MLELGAESKQEHQAILNQIDQLHINQVFLIGDEYFDLSIDRPYQRFKATEHMKDYLKKTPLRHHHILMKGSRKFKIETLVDLL